MKTTVIYHSADFDGIFCREIARKFLPNANLIGWDFSDKPLSFPGAGMIYVLDLPIDRVFGFETETLAKIERGIFVWIDHHKSSIESHPKNIPGYRIDGVAACRLAWQWFSNDGRFDMDAPQKEHYVNRQVSEPLAVRLAGEYDVWDKRDPDAERFQFGLRSEELTSDNWEVLLSRDGLLLVNRLLAQGSMLQSYQQRQDSDAMSRSFVLGWEGLKFLCLNTARCNSLTFASRDVPETGHDALMGFYFNGRFWTFSLYHAKHRTDLDLSEIAKRWGGGGHRGACGFTRLDINEVFLNLPQNK